MAARLARIKGKLYDVKTSNKSFLKVARDLKQLGVKNWYWMLELHDPSLISIDPFAVDGDGNTTLSKDQITRIITECVSNPWYYLREICRIPVAGGTYIPYKANRGNLAQAWCAYNGFKSWLCLPRQQGKTESAIALQTWAYLFGTSNSMFIFVNKEGTNAKDNLNRLKRQIEGLPQYLRQESLLDETGKRDKGKDNATEVANPVNHNRILIKNKAVNHEAAVNLGRGLSAPIIHFDEPEFTPYIKTVYENSVSTYNTTAAFAKANGAFHAMIFTCTPGDLDTQPGQDAQMMLDKTVKWKETFYDMNTYEIEDYIEHQGTMEGNNGGDVGSNLGIIYIEYSYTQIGKTREWFKKIAAEIGNPLTVRREILLQRLHGSDTSPYSRDDIEYIVSTQQEPIKQLTLLKYYDIDIYEELDRSIPYIIGVDCASGTLGDNNAITIIDPYKVRPVAEFSCNFIGIPAYEKLLMEIIKVIPRSVLCIEKNNMGTAIIQHLLQSPVANRIYFAKNYDLQAENMKQYEEVESMLKHEAKRIARYGIATLPKSRDQMFDILSMRIHDYKDDFVTKNIIHDISGLIKKSNGRIEAGPGNHDDSIMSYLIAMYVYYHGDNLEAFGIYKQLKPEDQNKGLIYPEEDLYDQVDKAILDDVKKQRKKEAFGKQQNEWDNILKAAIAKSQRETFELSKKNLVEDTIYDYTQDAIVDDFELDGNVDMGIFDTLNGYDKFRQQPGMFGVGQPDPYTFPI